MIFLYDVGASNNSSEQFELAVRAIEIFKTNNIINMALVACLERKPYCVLFETQILKCFQQLYRPTGSKHCAILISWPRSYFLPHALRTLLSHLPHFCQQEILGLANSSKSHGYFLKTRLKASKIFMQSLFQIPKTSFQSFH